MSFLLTKTERKLRFPYLRCQSLQLLESYFALAVSLFKVPLAQPHGLGEWLCVGRLSAVSYFFHFHKTHWTSFERSLKLEKLVMFILLRNFSLACLLLGLHDAVWTMKNPLSSWQNSWIYSKVQLHGVGCIFKLYDFWHQLVTLDLI